MITKKSAIIIFAAALIFFFNKTPLFTIFNLKNESRISKIPELFFSLEPKNGSRFESQVLLKHLFSQNLKDFLKISTSQTIYLTDFSRFRPLVLISLKCFYLGQFFDKSIIRLSDLNIPKFLSIAKDYDIKPLNSYFQKKPDNHWLIDVWIFKDIKSNQVFELDLESGFLRKIGESQIIFKIDFGDFSSIAEQRCITPEAVSSTSCVTPTPRVFINISSSLDQNDNVPVKKTNGLSFFEWFCCCCKS